MAAPRNETLIRTTDIVVDKLLDRLGTDGVSLGDDFADKINQALGSPVEVKPQSPTSKILTVGPAIYTLPDGQRAAILDDGVMPALASGTINFGTGVISTGANGSFSLPNTPAGNFVRALIQYKVDENKLNVTFGTANAVLASTGVPALLDDYAPVCLLELHSTGGGIGVFDNIGRSAMIKIYGGFKSGKGPVSETQDVTGSPKTVFTLTTITIPKNRKRLFVLENGIKLDVLDDYTIDSDTQVTKSVAAPVNARVTFIVI